MNYVLTDDAEADLRGIVRYTRKEWGAAQVRTYVAKLKVGIACVAAGPAGRVSNVVEITERRAPSM